MNVPSCTLRTRSTFGLNVIVNVITDTRDALLIDTGTVYGPPATWNVVPGTVRMICAGVAAARRAASPVSPACRIRRRRRRGASGAPAWSTGGMPGRHDAGRRLCRRRRRRRRCPGFSGTARSASAPATSRRAGRFTGCAPGSDATGGRGTRPARRPASSESPASRRPDRRRRASSGAGAISGGGPPSPRFCCVPM